MTLDESIQGMRLQVIRRATQIGVSAACGEAGISRTLFYRWQHRLSRYGIDGLHPRRLRARPGRRPQLPPQVERRLLAVAIAEATRGRAAAGGLRPTAVAAAGGGQHGAAPAAPARLDHPPAALARARTPQCPRRGLADATHAAVALAAAAWADASRRGRASRRIALSRASWNGCSRRFSLSTGAWSFAGTTSPAGQRWIGAFTGSCSSTTSSDHTMAIASGAGLRRPFSTAPWRQPAKLMNRHSGTVKVSTPNQVWTD